MRTRLLASLLTVSVAAASVPGAFWAGVAIAQMDADTKEAKALFEEGVKLYKDGKYEEARVKFKAAYGLKKRPSILINLARAELQTKRPYDAAMHFKECLTLPDLKPEDKSDATTGLADARKQIGTIVIDAPAGSTVQVDGAAVTVPDDNIIDVQPGMHTVSIKSAGKETNEKVTLDAGKSQTVHFKSDSGTTPPVVVPPVATDTAPTTTTTAPPTTTATPPPTTTSTSTTTTTTSTSSTVGPSPGFFASIHPVTYVAAGVTVVSAVLWIVFGSQAKTHSDNATSYADAINSSKSKNGGVCNTTKGGGLGCPTWVSEGKSELDSYNSDKNLATAFGIVTIVGAVATGVTFVLLRKKGTPANEGVSLNLKPTTGGGFVSFSGTF
jgi:hypothetical protein